MPRISLPSFLAGAALSLSLVAIPAYSMTSGNVDQATGPSDFDGSAPLLDVEPLNFVVGASIDNTESFDGDACDSGGRRIWHWDIPLEMNWSASDAGSGVESYDVLLTSRWTDGTVKAATDIQETTWPVVGSNYSGDCGGGSPDGQYRILARDHAGNLAISRGSSHPGVTVWQEDGKRNPPDNPSYDLSVAKVGKWRQGECVCFDAGHTLYSTKGGNSLTYEVDAHTEGQTVAIVMEKNSRKGEVGIRLNGGPVSVVDTYSVNPQHRVIVWEAELPQGSSTVKITNRGTAGRPRVDVDAVMKVRSTPFGELYLDFPEQDTSQELVQRPTASRDR